jgi:hypothetical protein
VVTSPLSDKHEKPSADPAAHRTDRDRRVLWEYVEM